MSEIQNKISMDTMKTPNKSSFIGECVTPCNAQSDECNCCSVCLSPLDEKNANHKGGVTTTRCQHKFHRKCIAHAKVYQATCPMCRTNLTPILSRQRLQTPASVFNSTQFSATNTGASSVVAGMYVPDGQLNSNVGGIQNIGTDFPEGMRRTAICAAASRARNAVRDAMLRRAATNAAVAGAL